MKEKAAYGRMKKTIIGGFSMSGKKGMKGYSQAIKEEADPYQACWTLRTADKIIPRRKAVLSDERQEI